MTVHDEIYETHRIASEQMRNSQRFLNSLSHLSLLELLRSEGLVQLHQQKSLLDNLSPDESLHWDLHELRERVAARVGQDGDVGCATYFDNGAGFGGAEEVEKGLCHEEGAFDVDFLVYRMVVWKMERSCSQVRQVAYKIVPEVV